MFVGLGHVFPGVADVAVGLEEFLPNNVQFFALLVGKGAGFVHDLVDIEETFGNDVDFVVAFLQDFAF